MSLQHLRQSTQGAAACICTAELQAAVVIMSGPLFKPFRALGYITEDVPFAVQRRGKETYTAVSVGRTWQVSRVVQASLAVYVVFMQHAVGP